MFEQAATFSGFSVDDIPAAKEFYGETLGVPLTEEHGMLHLRPVGGGHIVVYPKGAQHEPASFTILNFPVDDIDAAVEALAERGVTVLHYPGFGQEANGVMRRGGPPIAWFNDPAGNILAVLQDS